VRAKPNGVRTVWSYETMLTRTRRSETLARRVRERGAGLAPARVSRALRGPSAEPAPHASERRDVDPSQDVAVYNCHCGMVFDAPVSTTIACPHCGDAQGW
jgi:hypothetical protein